jgi:hypothetical protein
MSAPPVNGAPHWPANDDDRVGLARGGCTRQSAVLGHGRDNELCQRVGPGPGGVVGAEIGGMAALLCIKRFCRFTRF